MSATRREVVSQTEGDREHALAGEYCKARRDSTREGRKDNGVRPLTAEEEGERWLHHYEGFRDGRESDGEKFRRY